MNAVVQLEPRAVAVDRLPTPAGLAVTSFEQGVQMAKMISESKLVPTHLQGKPADCFLVVEQATRWGMSPFAVAQTTSVISGKLMFEGKLVTAVINGSGALAGRMRFDVEGAGDAMLCIASGTLRGESQPRTVVVNIKDVRTSNKMWSSQPEQQLCYSAARVWGRRHLPEVMLGVYSPEEDFGEVPTAGDVRPTVVSKPPAVAEKQPYPDDKFRANLTEWRSIIASGKRTPNQIVAMLETKATLTDEQRDTLATIMDGDTGEGA